ncbi:MAG: hypothetical protein EOM26_00045 [Alphaproteobacteria bacterium]|nr:hypothetical protein [Alphaproteobacteria bacterium]
MEAKEPDRIDTESRKFVPGESHIPHGTRTPRACWNIDKIQEKNRRRHAMKTALYATAMTLMLSAPAGVAMAETGSGARNQAGDGSYQSGAQTQPGAQGHTDMQRRGGTALNIGPDTVREIQQALNDQGYDAGDVDGVWGRNTAQALQTYQRSAGLNPTGEPNARTLQQLGVNVSGMGGNAGSGPSGNSDQWQQESPQGSGQRQQDQQSGDM